MDFTYPLDEFLVLVYGKHRIHKKKDVDLSKIRSFDSWSIWDLKKMEKKCKSSFYYFNGFDDYNW